MPPPSVAMSRLFLYPVPPTHLLISKFLAHYAIEAPQRLQPFTIAFMLGFTFLILFFFGFLELLFLSTPSTIWFVKEQSGPYTFTIYLVPSRSGSLKWVAPSLKRSTGVWSHFNQIDLLCNIVVMSFDLNVIS